MSLSFKNQGSDTKNSITVTSKRKNKSQSIMVATVYIIRDPSKKTY